MWHVYRIAIFCVLAFSCRKGSIIPPDPLLFIKADIDNKTQSPIYYDTRVSPVLKLIFNNSIDRQSVTANISLTENVAGTIPLNISYEKNDSVIVMIPQGPLKYLTRYFLRASANLQSADKT